MNYWGTKNHSFAGRAQLVSSVLFKIRVYWMSIFCLPQSVVKEIDNICRCFPMGKKEGECKIHVMAWDKVCSPKLYGGLGFTEGSKWNRASLGKYLGVIMFKQDSLGSCCVY